MPKILTSPTKNAREVVNPYYICPSQNQLLLNPIILHLKHAQVSHVEDYFHSYVVLLKRNYYIAN